MTTFSHVFDSRGCYDQFVMLMFCFCNHATYSWTQRPLLSPCLMLFSWASLYGEKAYYTNFFFKKKVCFNEFGHDDMGQWSFSLNLWNCSPPDKPAVPKNRADAQRGQCLIKAGEVTVLEDEKPKIWVENKLHSQRIPRRLERPITRKGKHCTGVWSKDRLFWASHFEKGLGAATWAKRKLNQVGCAHFHRSSSRQISELEARLV